MPGSRGTFLLDQNNWMLLALVPGAALRAWVSGAGLLIAIGCAIAWAFLLAPTSRARDGRRALPWHRQSSTVLMGGLCALWLPPTLPWWTFAIAILVAVALMRFFRDRPGASPFHPAMVGCAIALIFAPQVAPSTGDIAVSNWISPAYACGGTVLMVARRIRWQVPVILLATAVIAVGASFALPPPLASGIGGSIDSAASTYQQLLPAWALTIFFIASDPSSGCALPRSRWLFGIGIGLLMTVTTIVSSDITGALLGIAGAVLLMNAAAPWLDRICESPVPALRRGGADRQ